MSRFIILVIISFTSHISSKSDDNAVDFNFFDVEKIPENCNGWGQMKCWSGQCVSITNKCNGVQDCDDSSDEWSHFCRANFCEEDQFQCRYGACLPMKAKCNGKKECWDGTDEHEELCAIEIDTSLTSTTRIKTTAVTEGIVNPTIKATKKNKTAENANGPQTNTSVLDYSTHFEVIENSEKDLTTTSGVKTTRIQTTTNRPLVTTTKDTKTPFNALPTERPHLTTTSVKATISTQKTSASKPLLKPTTKANVTRNHSEKDLQITTPKRKTTKYSATLTTPTFSIDVPSETPSTQPKSNGNKGQEVRKIHNKLAVSQTTLSTPNVASQTTIFKTNLSSTPNYASVSNVSVQISINSQPQTDVLPNSPLYYVNKTLNTTETLRNLNYPGSITTTLSNRYNIKKTTPPSTTTKGTPKAIKLCILRNCGHPLFCNISLPGSLDSKSSHANQGRLYLMEGSQVIFNCADGYVLEGVNRTTCTAKGWSNKNPSCNPHCDVDFKSNCASPLKCSLEEPNIRSKTVIRNNFAETKVKEHSQLSFVCDDGYLLEGPKLRKCTTKGWSNVMPRCVNRCDVLDLGIPKSPLMCQLFDSNTGLSHYYQYSQRNRMIKEGSYLEYSCEYGYKLNGANRSTCTNNGWNSDAPTCKQTTCDAGILNDCTSPLNCERFDFAINNYRRIYKGNVQQLSQLEYLHLSCDDGYDLQGTQFLTCKGGKWQGTMPKCNERISNTCDKRILDNCTYPLICKRFDREFNDFRKINSATRQKSVSDVERIKVSCGYGYVLDGRNVLSCAAGKWDHNMPKCIASSCRFDLIPRCKHPLTCTWYDSKSQSEQITTDNNITESTSYALNTQIVFGCANGYKLKGEEQTICTSNGWTHEQSLKLPECTLQCDTDIFKSCKEPLVCFYLQPNKKFLQVSSDFLIEDVENSFIYFRCVNDYMLQGVDYINCNSKGWDNPMPECVSAYS